MDIKELNALKDIAKELHALNKKLDYIGRALVLINDKEVKKPEDSQEKQPL